VTQEYNRGAEAEAEVRGDEPMETPPTAETPIPTGTPMRDEMGAQRAEGAQMHEPSAVDGPRINDYRVRFEELQARFIDEPRSAVRSAQSLVEEAIDRIMQELGHTGDGESADTEQLRVTMKRYRELLYQFTETGSETTPETSVRRT